MYLHDGGRKPFIGAVCDVLQSIELCWMNAISSPGNSSRRTFSLIAFPGHVRTYVCFFFLSRVNVQTYSYIYYVGEGEIVY